MNSSAFISGRNMKELETMTVLFIHNYSEFCKEIGSGELT